LQDGQALSNPSTLDRAGFDQGKNASTGKTNRRLHHYLIKPATLGDSRKRNFLGRPMRAKGFEHRELALAWGVLTHNLWMLARLRKTGKKAVPLQKAA
jgi:hypothetical protein